MGTKITEETSLQLALLKLLSSIGVVYIHAYIVSWDFFVITPEKLSAVYYVQTIISQYVARFAVPVFFAVSGYIYFSKQYQDSNWKFFCRKAKSLLWPYMLWNSIAIFYIFLLQTFILPHKESVDYHPVSSFNAARWLNAYVGWTETWNPFLYVLWFLPFLFIAFIVVHIFRKYFYRHEWLIWSIAAINLICTSIPVLSSYLTQQGPFLRLLYAITFFSTGSLLLKYRTIVEQKTTLFFSGVISIALLVINLLKLQSVINLNMLFLYAELVFIFSLTSGVGKCGQRLQNVIIFLSGFSFLIYITHDFAMEPLTYIIYPLIPAKTWSLLLPYFLIPVVVISLLITGGYLLKKLLPKVYDFLFNGR